jgi:YHS domain-containing protein
MWFSSARRFVLSSGAAAFLTAALTAAGQLSAINTNRTQLAIHGYDAVAYTTNAAVRGDAQFEHRWNGAVWRFATAANRERFAAEPEKYAPQFGGYCAWAVSRGYTADIDPEAFRIVDGRLYLNYSKSVRRMWERDIPGNIAKAEAHWPAVLSK